MSEGKGCSSAGNTHWGDTFILFVCGHFSAMLSYSLCMSTSIRLGRCDKHINNANHELRFKSKRTSFSASLMPFHITPKRLSISL